MAKTGRIAFAVFALAVVIPSAPVIQKYFGGGAVTLYFAIAFAGLLVASRFVSPLNAQRRTVVLSLAAVAFATVLLAFLILYPIANVHVPGRGSDSDDALDVATRLLVTGRFPYGQPTYLGNPAIPMPGELLLAIPFVLLGGSAYQFMFWIPMAFVWLSRIAKSQSAALWLLATPFLLSPVLMAGVATGSDHLSNSIIVFTGFLLALRAGGSESVGWRRLASLVFFGITLSTRANFVFLLPVLFGATARVSGRARAFADVAIAAVVAVLVTAPFYLADPTNFAPLHTAEKTSSIPFGWLVVPMLTLGVSIPVAWRLDGSLAGALKGAFTVLLTPVVLLTAVVLVRDGSWDMAYYGDLVMIFGIASFGVEWIAQHGTTPRSTTIRTLSSPL